MAQAILTAVLTVWAASVVCIVTIGLRAFQKTARPLPRVLPPAVPRDTDADAPCMDEIECARLGHAYVTRTGSLGMTFRSCPRCGAAEKLGGVS